MGSINPLTANDELSRHENLTLLWTWTLRWVPKSFATHVQKLAVKELRKTDSSDIRVVFTFIFISGEMN